MIAHTRRGLGAMRLPTLAQKPRLVGSSDPNVGRLGQKIHRPQMTSRAGSSVTITRNVTPMADGVDRAQPGGRVELGEAQAEHADRHGRGAGQDGRRRAVQREGHRLVAVLVAAQLLAVAGHEQQGVVGAGADHQDAHDRLALGVDREVGVLGQQVDHAGRGHEGEDGAEDRQDPEERAAVGEQQDHDHHEEGGQDQVGVDALERLGGVGGLTAVARQVDGDAVDLGDLTHVLGGGWDVVPAVLRRS